MFSVFCVNCARLLCLITLICFLTLSHHQVSLLHLWMVCIKLMNCLCSAPGVFSEV